MRIEIKMPDLGTNEDEVRIVKWLIEPGERVALGQELLEVETDKATMAVESVAEGILQEILVPADEEATTDQIIAIIEDGVAETWSAAEASAPAVAPAAAATASTVGEPAHGQPAAGRARAGSMFARNRQTAAGATTATPTHQEVPLGTTQRIVGARLQESQRNAPHFYLQTSFNAEPMAAARESQAGQIVWDALVVKAVAAALEAFPRMRCRMDGEKLVRRPAVAVGVAVDVDDELFVVPVEDPGSQDAGAISEAIRAGVEKIRQGDGDARKLKPAEITVTNLGGAGVDMFLPIINPPEASILSLGMVRPMVIADEGQIKIQRRANLSIAVDHRIVNGKYAARFLNAIVSQLESL